MRKHITFYVDCPEFLPLEDLFREYAKEAPRGCVFSIAPALISYLCMRLKMIGFLVCYAKPYSRYYHEHLLYAWFVYHCRSLHRLGDSEGLPFY